MSDGMYELGAWRIDTTTPGGRQPVITQEKLRRARTLLAKGFGVRDAAVRLRVGKTALYEVLRQPADPQ